MNTREDLETLLNPLRSKIISYVDRRCPGYGEDLYNATWVECLKLLRGVRKEHPYPQRLIWSIVKNLVVDEHRSAVRLVAFDHKLPDWISPLPSPEECVLMAEYSLLIQSGLNQIPQFDRNILEERYGKGTRALDIARSRGIRPSVVRLQLYRARRRLDTIVRRRKEKLTA